MTSMLHAAVGKVRGALFRRSSGDDERVLARPDSDAIVYVGNGATRAEFTDRLRRRGLDGAQSRAGSGTGACSAVQTVTGAPGATVVIEGFTQPGASFVGYHARRRLRGTWHWLLADGGWQETSATMGPKRLLRAGDDLAEWFTAGQRSSIVLVAQWVDGQGRTANTGAAMFTHPLMAHALGGLRELTYHNTSAAFDEAVRQGHRYVEVDLSYTTDRRLVATHGWSRSACRHTGVPYEPGFEQITYDQAMRLKTHGDQVMDAQGLYRLVKAHPDIRFEVDFHNVEGEAIKDRVRSLVDDFEHDEEALDRLLVQAYSEQMHRDIDAVHRFRHYQFLIGARADRLDEIITYCLDEGICAVALRWNFARPQVVQLIKNAGLFVLGYTVVADAAVAAKLLSHGVDTVCTDFVTPADLAEATAGDDMAPSRFLVYYNGGDPEVEQHYTDDGVRSAEVKRTPGGTLEYTDQRPWVDDGSRRLEAHRFRVPGRRFVGWKLRVRVDGRVLWACRDGLYRTKGQLKEKGAAARQLYADQETLPVMDVVDGAKLIMVAVWEDAPAD